MKPIKLNQIDRHNLSAGFHAVVWPYLIFSHLGFGAAVAASALCVAIVAALLFRRNRKRYAGCDWRSHLLTLAPAIAYWTLAAALQRIFG